MPLHVYLRETTGSYMQRWPTAYVIEPVAAVGIIFYYVRSSSASIYIYSVCMHAHFSLRSRCREERLFPITARLLNTSFSVIAQS